jgi:protein-S-isoprenylcysteine O-methyltransferase Ste14
MADDGDDRRRRTLGWVLVAVQFILIAALILVPWRRSAPWPPDLSLIIGGALALIGVLIAIAGFLRLGSALTPTPVPIEGAELRTTGIYSWVRHPIYSGLLLASAGFVIAVGSLATFAVWLLLCVFFVLKHSWEDRLLAERHGAAWQEYAQRVGGLIPWRASGGNPGAPGPGKHR